MRAVLVRTALAGLVSAIACGCGTTHTLHVTSVGYFQPKQCTIGVKRFMDESGVDLSFALRDYLRQHGPCRHVILVAGDNDSRADVVVSGSAHADLTRGSGTSATGYVGQYAFALPGAVALGVGLPLWGIGIGDGNAKQASVGGTLTLSGAAAVGVGVALELVDSSVEREMKLTGTVDAEIDIEASGASLANWSDHDEVVSRGRQPAGRPESRDSVEAAGTLYPEFYRRIFADISNRLGDALDHLPDRNASGHKPGAEAAEHRERRGQVRHAARVSGDSFRSRD